MKASRLHLAYPPPVRELQGMIRTDETGRAKDIDITDAGLAKVTLKTGEVWLCSSTGVACMVDEPAPQGQGGKRR